jgi:hypothetical protein
MEEECNMPWAGRGVEIDWLRQLWDVRTDGTSPPSMNSMITWIDWTAGVIWKENAYQQLSSAADIVGGTLNATWDSRAPTNGVDH